MVLREQTDRHDANEEQGPEVAKREVRPSMVTRCRTNDTCTVSSQKWLGRSEIGSGQSQQKASGKGIHPLALANCAPLGLPQARHRGPELAFACEH